MIGKLTGQIEHCLNGNIILNVNGVGYLITVPSYISQQTQLNETISLFIETIIRPEMITLYGFKSLDEKELFQKLMSVQGVGGKSASAILSIMSPSEILDAIISQDSSAFKKADGIGPKVASRIVIELKDYAQKQGHIILTNTNQKNNTAAANDGLSTLLQLGYKRHEAQQAIQKALETNPSATTEQLIPAALKLLAKNI